MAIIVAKPFRGKSSADLMNDAADAFWRRECALVTSQSIQWLKKQFFVEASTQQEKVMQVCEYIIVQVEPATKEGAYIKVQKILVPTTQVIAKNEEQVKMLAAQANPSLDLTSAEVLVRPFACR